MYRAIVDPYCYRGTTVLRNRLGIRDADHLEAFEEEIVKQRAGEPFPAGRLSVAHYRAIHRHLFQDVYTWAGRFRSVRIAKGESMFAYPEHVAAGMRDLFAWLYRRDHLKGLSAEEFARHTAHFLAELNALHAFRDGNGRSQLAFTTLLAAQAGYPFDLDRLDPAPFLAAMIASFRGDEALLAHQIRRMVD